MKILLYVNPDKDISGEYSAKIVSLLKKHGILFDLLSGNVNLTENFYDAMIVVGGDGTLLRRTETANLYNIPIIGINCGRLGFLSEFEFDEAENAILSFKNGNLVRDERLTLKIRYNGNEYYALNDVSFSRIYEENTRMVVSFGITIGSANMRKIIGDGVIVSTPTGSTAYSLSAGGPVIEPHVNALCITPVAAHSLSARSIVCSSDNPCVITHEGGAKAGLFIDGKLVATLRDNDIVYVSQAENKTVFLRRKGFDFFNRLNKKLQNR